MRNGIAVLILAAALASEAAGASVSGDLPQANVSGDLPQANVSGDPPQANVSGDPPQANVSGDPPQANVSGDPPQANVSGDPPQANVSGDPPQARQQALLYLLKQDCGSCHGLTLKGGLGPALLPEALRDKSDTMLVDTILHGRPGTPMPPWAFSLTADEALWLVQRLRTGTVDG